MREGSNEPIARSRSDCAPRASGRMSMPSSCAKESSRCPARCGCITARSSRRARRLAPAGPRGLRWWSRSAASRLTASCIPQRTRARLVGRHRRARAGARCAALSRSWASIFWAAAARPRTARGAPFPSVRTYDQAELLLRLSIISASRACAPSSVPPTAAWWRWPSPSGIRSGSSGCWSSAPRTAPIRWRPPGAACSGACVRYALSHGEGGARAWSWRGRWPWRPTAARRNSRRASARHRSDSGDEFVFPGGAVSVCARRATTPAHYRPESFLCLSESIDLHRGGCRAHLRRRPRWSACARISWCRSRTCGRSPRACRTAQLHEISSLYGHDAFLKEAGQLRARLPQLPGEFP